mgnify:CR=1 FL=1
MSKKLTAIAFASLTSSSFVFADSYFNVGVSMNSIESNTTITGTHTTNHDEDSNKAYFDFGYFFNEHLAAEIGYRSGENKERYSFSGTPLHGDTEVDVLKIGLKVFTSTEADLYGFGGIGLAMMDVETTITDNSADTASYTNGQKLKDDSNNVYFTLGTGYKLAENLAVEASYANYGKAGDSGNDVTKPSEFEYSEFTIGISYKF